MRLKKPSALVLTSTILLLLTPLLLWLLEIPFLPGSRKDISAFPDQQSSVGFNDSPQVTSVISGIPTAVEHTNTTGLGEGILSAPTSIYPLPSDSETKAELGQNPTWEFNTTRDSRNYRLTTSQCDIAFPGLFNEIERAVAFRKKKGKVTIDDIDLSWKDFEAVKALIVDQQLYILEAKFSTSTYDSTRALAILHALHRAIVTSPQPLPNIEFSFVVSDIADPAQLGYPVWVLARTAIQEEKWLMSDFGYWSWPLDLIGGYEQIRREILDTEIDFLAKKQQAVWRGAIKTNKHRKDLMKVTANKEWADVHAIEWANSTMVKGQDAANALTMPEHCQYQFVIQTEGRSYSGRGKYLQNCKSVLIQHKRTWIEPHHGLLVASGPQQNFVEVENDFSDLEEKVLELLKDPERAQSIALQGVHTFRERYLTPTAQACYWRSMIRGWAEVSFVPAVWDFEEKTGKRKTRGVPFETFV